MKRIRARAEQRTVGQHISDLLAAIKACYEKELITASLMLTYSTIDILAWLDRKTGQADVKPSDFINWVDTYLLPNSDLPCQAIDLWGARCGLLHSYISASRVSRKGKALELHYCWGDASTKAHQECLDELGINAKSIKVEKLFGALENGIHHFLIDMGANPDKAKVVHERSKQFFKNVRLRDLGNPEKEVQN